MKVRNKNQRKFKVRVGDEVMILAGRSRGETGKIEQLDFKNNRVYIAGKNLGKSHTKPNLNNQEGGIIDIPLPLHISKVALLDPKTGKPTRIGFKVEDGKKVRIARKSGTTT